MLNFLMGLWDRNNRNFDLNNLWPICKQHAEDLDDARAAFYLHVVNDTAWTNYYSETELVYFVNNLK